MLKLSSPITPSTKIQPIKLPSDCGKDILNKVMNFVGTGFTDTDFTDDFLREIKLKTLPSEQCPLGFNDIPGVICTQSTVNGTPYFGDSGEF